MESISGCGWSAGDTMADGKGKHCEQAHYGNVMSGDHKEKPLQTKAYQLRHDCNVVQKR